MFSKKIFCSRFVALRKGNKVNPLHRFRVHDRDRQALQESQCHKAALVVLESVILKSVRSSFENLSSVDEIKAVILQILLPLDLLPCESPA